ncbi:(Fe-S)-binding protein [Campylobacterota bacterium]|nr:(Fe-S)-binding protein [Campylobacterota bacterium]
MVRKLIVIDEEKCDGCGECVGACAEGALALVDGKAKLLRDDYCDGLGNCLPACHTGAITFVEREAAAYDEEAVKAHIASQHAAKNAPKMHFHAAPNAHTHAPTHAHEANEAHECGCPGSKATVFAKKEAQNTENIGAPVQSQLRQWPVQIKLVSPNASFFDGAELLIAADCCAYAYGNFHNDFMQGKVTVIGCPKLDMIDYTQKLHSIIANHNIRSLTVVKMEVPCCTGIEHAAANALASSGKKIPFAAITLSLDGAIL